jgi:hypothetical protein
MRSLILLFFLMPEIALAEFISINCSASSGYAYYFEGGFVGKKNSGFTEDRIFSGQISLTFDTEKQEGDILTKDATGALKSASSQGGMVIVIPASNKGLNWFAVYADGTLEIYSYNFQSNKVASYRNTVGNSQVAKNSLMIASCNE